MKNILVTGAAGFIGSAFARYLVKTYPQYTIIVYDKLTYAGNMNNLKSIDGQYAFVKGDIADREAVQAALQKYDVDTVVNFAAESHVDRSILDPNAFIQTDVVGVYVMLDESLKHGVERFLQVSTDEVYGDIDEGLSVEDDVFLPNSPYAASKAGGEMMVRSYHITHGMNTVITRGSNTYGPYQYPEKLMPLFITEAMDNKPLPLYGDGMQIRDWLYVDDHVTGIDVALHHGESGEAYNIAGENERHNIHVVKMMLKELGKPESLIKHVPDREGHDRRYAMDSSKLRALGWKRQYDPETFAAGLKATVDWYVNNAWWWEEIKTGDYLDYYKKQYAGRLAAADK